LELPILSASDLSRKRLKKAWARLIQKVYNLDPLKCPKCGGKMRIISFIEDELVIKKILSHLNLLLPHYHDPPDNSTDDKVFKLNTYKQRSYEWWEMLNTVTSNASANTGTAYAGAAADEYYTDCQYQTPHNSEFPEEVFRKIHYDEFSQEVAAMGYGLTFAIFTYPGYNELM
jgi:hypothetical protein